MRKFTASFVAVLLAIAPVPALAGTMQLLGGSSISNQVGRDASASAVVALPYSGRGSVAGQSGSSSATYRLTETRFDIVIDQLSVARPYVGQSGGEMFFTVSGDSLYALQTTYAGSGGLSSDISVNLTDVATGQTLFSTSAGQPEQVLPGGFTGTLEAGRAYALRYDVESTATSLVGGVLNRGAPGGPVLEAETASVNLSFQVQRVTVVPLPAALWGGLALLSTLGASRAVRASRRN